MCGENFYKRRSGEWRKCVVCKELIKPSDEVMMCRISVGEILAGNVVHLNCYEKIKESGFK